MKISHLSFWLTVTIIASPSTFAASLTSTECEELHHTTLSKWEGTICELTNKPYNQIMFDFDVRRLTTIRRKGDNDKFLEATSELTNNVTTRFLEISVNAHKKKIITNNEPMRQMILDRYVAHLRATGKPGKTTLSPSDILKVTKFEDRLERDLISELDRCEEQVRLTTLPLAKAFARNYVSDVVKAITTTPL